MKKKKKLSIKNLVCLFILIICIVVFIYSLINVIKWYGDSNNTKKEIDNISNTVNVIEVDDNSNTEVIEQKEKLDENNPYYSYIKMKLINVDFTELESINKDTVGWIQVNGTNINYPFVQTTDNSYYLTHSFENKSNNAGWVFLDYRNNHLDINKNNIIYAHGRVDKTMFGSLKNILTSGWINDTNNYVIKLSTKSYNTLWQVFSVYKIETTSDYLKINFNSDKEFIDFSNMLINRSQYNFNTSLDSDDKLLTLSTCYNEAEKVVLHAKLIKKEKRL